MVLLTGAAKFLFTPLAEAVAFAMMASYFLSRTLVADDDAFSAGQRDQAVPEREESDCEERRSFIWRWHMRFDRKFERMQHHYKVLLEWCLEHAGITLGMFGLLLLVSLPMTFFIGKDFFPYVDSGQMRLHVTPPQGLAVEDSELYFANVEQEIRKIIPPDRLNLMLEQHRSAEQRHQPGFWRLVDDFGLGWRDPDCTESRRQGHAALYA